MKTEQRNGLLAVSAAAEEIAHVEIVQLGGKTMGEWYAAQEDKPDMLMNASLWDGKGAIGTIWQDGKLVRNEGTGFGFGMNPAGGWGFGDPWAVSWRDYITGYPALVKAGKALSDSVDGYVMNSITKRSAVAAAGNRLYFITADSMTVAGLRKALVSFGVYSAINLDGGGSSRLFVNGKAVNHPTDDRRCPNAIAVWLKKDHKGDYMSKRVFLGVGHGGKDSGATADGHREKDMTLTMALACKAELERHGVKVGISRTRDEDDPLNEEVKECNAFAPDLAVDIHVNAGGGDGFEAYHTLSGGVGKVLAQNIEAEVKALGQNSRGCKTRANSAGKDYYGFVRLTKCPAVIVEIGFIDNAKDRAAFDSKAEQQAFGRAYARGILTTLGVKHLPEGEQTSAPEQEMQELIVAVQKRFGFEEQTMEYLVGYRYAKALLERLAKK